MYLLDSDVARKICQYELLYELASALGCGIDGFAVLPQLQFQLRLADAQIARRKMGSDRAVELAILLVETAAKVEVVVETANPLLSLNRPDIDSGEAALFAALHDRDEDWMISGDKKAFVALSKVDGIEVIDALWARMICLDEAIRLVMARVGFELVSERVRAKPDVDIAISIVFGRSAANEQQAVEQGLRSYMMGLQAETGGMYRLDRFSS